MPDKKDERNSTDTRISPYRDVNRDEPEPSMRTRDTPRTEMRGGCRRRIYFVKGRVHRRCAPSDCMTVGIPNTGKCSLKRASRRLPRRESEVLRMIYHTRRKAAIHAGRSVRGGGVDYGSKGWVNSRYSENVLGYGPTHCYEEETVGRHK